MQKTPLSNRMHIGIFGKRNVGKSTLINALTDQDIAIVSDIPGTTTDPVYKAMEIHGLGPVVLIDTGGIDDEGTIGVQRVRKAYSVLNKTDLALLVIEKDASMGGYEETFLEEIRKRNIPAIVVINKIDASSAACSYEERLRERKIVFVCASAKTGRGIEELIQSIRAHAPEDYERKLILKDLLAPSDLVVVVAPLDIEAPKGRLKLPQVQTIRDILDSSCITVVVKETELSYTLKHMNVAPKLVITESQVFERVARIVPREVPLTSFSVLYARYKGELDTLVAGARAIDELRDRDKVLIAESCTHHPIGDDVGRKVIPELLAHRLAQKQVSVDITHVSGYEFPHDLSGYRLVIHCGACMLNRREMVFRIDTARRAGIAMTNYGIAIAYLTGILERVVEPFRVPVGASEVL